MSSAKTKRVRSTKAGRLNTAGPNSPITMTITLEHRPACRALRGMAAFLGKTVEALALEELQLNLEHTADRMEDTFFEVRLRACPEEE